MEGENRQKTNQRAVSRVFAAPLARNAERFIVAFEDQLRESNHKNLHGTMSANILDTIIGLAFVSFSIWGFLPSRDNRP